MSMSHNDRTPPTLSREQQFRTWLVRQIEDADDRARESTNKRRIDVASAESRALQDVLREFDVSLSEARCELCGELMPPSESMFKYHGYSGPCPKPPLPAQPPDLLDALHAIFTAHGIASRTKTGLVGDVLKWATKAQAPTVEALAAQTRACEAAQVELKSLKQQVEDTVLVAVTDSDEEGFITAYHFKTGAIHRLLAKARQ